jgi:hypothetical protein
MINKDLIILTADKNAQALMQVLTGRIQQVEDLSPFTYEVVVHPKRDPGVVTNCYDYLRIFLKSHNYCIVLFDHEGCGKEKIKKQDLEKKIEQQLSANGWKNRNCCIVLVPELETWIWVNEIRIQELIDWQDSINIYKWLKKHEYIVSGFKPKRPKEAFEVLLRKQGIARSSSLYSELASLASYKKCIDSAFLRLKNILYKWFKKKINV